jgi:alpha-2-macroglobulin
MKRLLLLVACALFAFSLSISAHQDSPAELRARAEAHRSEESYELARRAYAELLLTELAEDEAREIRVAFEDCRWRAASATRQVDQPELEAARIALEAILAEYERPEDHDETWSAANASLGDYHWQRRWSGNFGAAWPYYQAALSFWESSPDIDRARVEYLAIARRAAQAGDFGGWRQNNHSRNVPVELLQKAARVATLPEDRAWTQLYLALSLEHRDVSEARQRKIESAFQAAIEQSVGPWSEHALYRYGVWLEERGEFLRDEQGVARTRPDYLRAVVIFRRYLEEYDRGKGLHWNSARDRIKNITETEVSLTVDGAFLPGSDRIFRVRWRNATEVELSLIPVDLGRDVQLESKDDSPYSWLERIDPAGKAELRRWTHQTNDTGEHRHGDDLLEIPGELESGAYLLQASSGSATSRQLVLVSEAALMLKDVGSMIVAWAADVADGRPRSDSRVTLFHRRDHNHAWKKYTAQTDADGLARFKGLGGGRGQSFATVTADQDQAFALVWGNHRWSLDGRWKLYVSTDRPAYRPGDEVHWKLVARKHENDTLATPAGHAMHIRVRDPRGNQVFDEALTLNDFGSVWSSLECKSAWPLGEYHIEFLSADEKHSYGSATLFRLEEYKLPEFTVEVVPAVDDSGTPKLFRVSETIEAEVRATYAFGGPVAGARTQVIVHGKAYTPYYEPTRRYPWFHQRRHGYSWGKGDHLATLDLVTDDQGVARVEFAPEWEADGALELTFEARVIDSSRREVTGEGVVRASRTAYHLALEPRHRVYHPGEELELDIYARDANDQGVAVTGELLLMRQTSYEIWRDPSGRRWTAGELERERARYAHFPPAPDEPDGPAWERIEHGEHSEFIGRFPAHTDDDGAGQARIAVAREGSYLVRWIGEDIWGQEVTAETRVFFAAEGTHELGYRANGVELHVDRDTLRVGEDAIVLVTTEAPGRWVLFAVEANGLLDLRVVHVSGSAKLLRLPVTKQWVPNVFLDAFSLSNGRVARDREELIVPPDDHFLEVDVALEPAELGPGETGTLVVTARDVDGEPVEAEVAIAVYDAMVEAIQADPAIDPREFFYGEKRRPLVSTSSSFDQLVYRRLVDLGEQRWKDQSGSWGRSNDQGLRDQIFEDADGSDDFFKEGKTETLGRTRQSMGPSSPAPASRFAVPGDAVPAGEGLHLGMDVQDDPQAELPAIVVRSDFRDTAFWSPDVKTSADGTARVSWTYPDNLTTWKASARATTTGSDFGIGRGEALTTKPLLVRVQAPRFLVVGDEAIVSLNLNNRTGHELNVTTGLIVDGVELLGTALNGELAEISLSPTIPANGSVRREWLVRATKTGLARFAGTVRADELSDGAERKIPVEAYGIDALAAVNARVRGDGAVLNFDLPEQRDVGNTTAVVQVAPNLALGLIDALPYLIEYPYGCTEQTLSRFVPAAIVKRTLEGFGLSAQEPLARAFGGITPEARAALFDADHTSIDELDQVTAAGVARLSQAQRSDGSWGWWPSSSSDTWMTAYAVWGLSLARDAGVELEPGMLDRGSEWLLAHLAEEGENADLGAWMLHALATHGGVAEEPRFAAAFDRAFDARGKLAAYGKALLCLAAARSDRTDSAQILSRNLIDGVVRTQPDTSLIQPLGGQGGTAAERAHWGQATGWRRWYQGGVETTSFCLWALLETDPEHELIEPASQWLLANRRAAQWTNTRDTSIAVLALSEYLARKGNLDAPVEYEVLVNGTVVAHERLEGDDLLVGAARIAVPTDLLVTGRNSVEVRRIESAEPLDVSVWANFFTHEERIAPRGNELYVRRQYFKLVGRPTLLAGYAYDRVPLADGDSVASGDRVECVLSVEAKTDLEYLVLEDLKPGGLEAGGVQSGSPLWASELTRAEARFRFGADRARTGVGARDSGSGSSVGTTGRSQHVHQEWRDRTVGLFLDRLPEGVWEVRYELRAETPGRFHALPVIGSAMYVPEIRANGTNQLVEVVE